MCFFKKKSHQFNYICLRLLVLKKYGGIYLDNDIYVINNLDKYRRFEFTLGWPDGEWIGNMLLMGHKDARFITQFIDTYKNYRQVVKRINTLSFANM